MTRRAMLVRAGLAGGAALVVNLILVAFSTRYDAVGVTLVVLCAVALATALIDGMTLFAPVRWPATRGVERRSPPTEVTLARYERLLERHRVAKQPDDDLQRRILALAERRLAQVHGLSRDTHSEAEVRRRLGAELTALKDQPARRLTPRQINRMIDRIEEL